MTTPSGTPGTPSPDASAPAPEKVSLFEDFIDVFYAPAAVFTRRQNAGFWTYFLILVVISAVFTLASRSVMSAALDAEFTRNMAKAMAENPRLTEEMVATQRGVSEKIGMFMMYLGMPLLVFFVGILTWIGARLAGAKLAFDRAMLVASIAQIPRLLGALLTAIYAVLLSDTSGITGMTSLTYGPARYFDPETANPVLLAVLARFDIFTLWVTLLIGIGIAIIARVPRGKGYAAAAIVWAIPTVIGVVGALM